MNSIQRLVQRCESLVASLGPQARWVVLGFACSLGYLTVFVLPWYIPIQVKSVVSDAQAAGFNNRAATLGLGFAVLCIGAFSGMAASGLRGALITTRVSIKRQNRVSRVLFATVSATSVVAISALGWFYGPYPISEGWYFTDRLTYLVGGISPRLLEFSYGPLLLYPEYLLYRVLKTIGVGLFTSYYIWVAVFYTLGLAILAFVLNRLSLPRTIRNVVFVLVGVSALVMPTLGLSYTLVRFVGPFGLVVGGLGLLCDPEKPVWIRLCAPSAAAVVAFGLSPELGVAVSVALIAGIVLLTRGPERWVWWSAVLLGATAVASVGVLMLSGASTLTAFAGGAFCFPILPGPMALLYVGAVLALAALAAPFLRTTDPRAGALLAAWLILATALIVPALGRADAAHMYWNGLGMAVLLTALLARWRKWVALLFVSVFVGLYAFATISTGLVAYLPPAVISGARNGTLSQAQVAAIANLPALQGTDVSYGSAVGARLLPSEEEYLLRQSRVAVPYSLGGDILIRLAERRALAPTYVWSGTLAISDAQSEAELRDLGRAGLLAMPAGVYDSLAASAVQPPTPGGGLAIRAGGFLDTTLYGRLMLYPVELPAKYPDFDPGPPFTRAVMNDWAVVVRSPRLVVLRRR